ncbi:MAG: isochorismatase family protein [Candidatus Gastranaerophilales bacterium]|nr:isochorismatase family protein [Candidatus Gastranaerophilales bacterium]
MLNRENCALVIIDIQDRLVLASKYGQEVSMNMSKLAKAADILTIPTIVTEQYPAGLGNTTIELKNSLPLNAFITEKSSFSAMLEPAFAEKINILKQSGRNQIVLGGIETHICVLQTACDLIKEGFEVYIIKDACASRNKKEYKTGLELLKQYGAKISCIEITLFEWLKTSKHPNFREIQALIK